MMKFVLLLCLLFLPVGQAPVEPIRVAILTQGQPSHAQELERLVRAELQKPELRHVVIVSYEARYDLHFTVGELDEGVDCRGFAAVLTVVDQQNRKTPPAQSIHTGRDLPYLARHLVKKLEQEYFAKRHRAPKG